MATKDSLREALAARFANVFLPRVTDALPYARLHEWQKRAWREMADECIRQMEWAFSNGAGLSCSVHSEEDEDMQTHGIAPEDWKP